MHQLCIKNNPAEHNTNEQNKTHSSNSHKRASCSIKKSLELLLIIIIIKQSIPKYTCCNSQNGTKEIKQSKSMTQKCITEKRLKQLSIFSNATNNRSAAVITIVQDRHMNVKINIMKTNNNLSIC